MQRTTTLLIGYLFAATSLVAAQGGLAQEPGPDTTAAAGDCRVALSLMEQPGDAGDQLARLAEISGSAPLQLRSFVRPSRTATSSRCTPSGRTVDPPSRIRSNSVIGPCPSSLAPKSPLAPFDKGGKRGSGERVNREG